MAFDSNFIYELKLNNPIDSVMGSYVRLIRRGKNYICLCPFHSEKTPSCTVFTDLSSPHFHCFGCGAGGDVITFIMLIESLAYPEAVRFLAERAGMAVPDDGERSYLSDLKARILEINRKAARHFHETLINGRDALKARIYLDKRGLSRKIITKYGIGYAAAGWSGLGDYMKADGYLSEELIAAGLQKQGKNGAYDFFRDRIMFPIIDLRGNVIAFGGRILDGDGPKYLNTGDTLAFKKSRNLFSMNFAKKSAQRRLILAEGYMDVVSINQAGFENVVATLGTALTGDQARLISQYADEAIIAYDTDDAGRNATQKAVNLLSESGVSSRILPLENAKDPDEYIKKFGAQRFGALIEKSDGAVNFRLSVSKKGLDLDSDTGKVEYLKRCVEVLSEISSPIEREIYISKLSAEYNVNKDTLSEQIKGAMKKKASVHEKQEWADIRAFNEARRKNPELIKNPKLYKAETGIISYLSANPDELYFVAGKITKEHFTGEFNKKVYELLCEGLKKSSDFDIMSLQSEFKAEEMGKITEIIVKNKDIDVSKEMAEDFFEILLNNKETIKAGELSDDEFRKYSQELKRKK